MSGFNGSPCHCPVDGEMISAVCDEIADFRPSVHESDCSVLAVAVPTDGGLKSISSDCDLLSTKGRVLASCGAEGIPLALISRIDDVWSAAPCAPSDCNLGEPYSSDCDLTKSIHSSLLCCRTRFE